MDKRLLPQFSLRGALGAIGVFACELGLLRWCGADDAFIAVPATALPFCVAMELALSGKRPPQPRMSFNWYAKSHALLALGGALVSAGAMASLAYAGVPKVVAPLPFCTIIAPLFSFPLWIDAAIPFGAYVLANLYLGRTSLPAPLPLRYFFLLGIGSMLTAYWFYDGWSYGIEFQGRAYVWAELAINAGALAILWLFWLWRHRRATRMQATMFGMLFFLWLFLFGFAWLGELP
ncbi:MAG TPA: hypothetical protein VFI31_02265 [Pirellulales bacterium]|nr:hypothetical protein [Pirellulales bacterium]